MSPHLDLALFAELQRQRIARELASKQPKQTFTARPRKLVVGNFGHGTLTSYVHRGCRCGLCAGANQVYRERQAAKQRLRQADAPRPRAKRRTLPNAFGGQQRVTAKDLRRFLVANHDVVRA